MSLQPLHFVDTPHVQVSGDVTIHPSAAIAPGVILRAAPNSRIVIAGGVCIGMGVILNAYHGAIEIEAGASLGPGVLMVGAGTIGANACVGGATTVFETSIDPMQVIPAGSLLGDSSRRLTVDSVASEGEEVEQKEAETEDPWGSEVSSPPSPSEEKNLSEETSKPKPPGTPVYGQVRVNQLLFTLFPQGQSFDRHQNPPKP